MNRWLFDESLGVCYNSGECTLGNKDSNHWCLESQTVKYDNDSDEMTVKLVRRFRKRSNDE